MSRQIGDGFADFVLANRSQISLNEHMKLYIASDHAGFQLKSYLLENLKIAHVSVVDLGPIEFDPNDDYPDYAEKVANAVIENTNSRGILICKNGVGVCITANKF